MRRHFARGGALLFGMGLLAVVPCAHAFIKAEDYPLKKAIDTVPHIFMAKVDKLDADKKTAVLVVGDPFGKKEKPSFAKLPIGFNRPDDEGADEGHVGKMLKRLANDLPVVIFVYGGGQGDTYHGIGYTNGTWFHMINADPAKQPWRFLHCEIYLRGTFKGTTEEMKQTIQDYLAKKKDPPEVNPKEPAGLGPEVGKPQGRLPQASGPLFAVIPTVAIGGPLAILSMLFPTLFGKPKEILNRYLALLTTTSIICLVYLPHAYFEQSIKDYWWGTPGALWSFMAIVTVVGMVWAWRRHKVQSATAAAQLPQKGEIIGFQVLSLIGLALIPYWFGTGELMKSGREYLLVAIVIWCGMLAILRLRRVAATQPEAKTAIPIEGAMLAGLAVTCLGMAFLLRPAAATEVVERPPISDEPADEGPGGNIPKLLGVAWTFPHKGAGTMDSTPLVTDKHVYIAVKIAGAFGTSGRVYCLDRATRKVLWKFDDDGVMKAVFSTPFLADGRLYVGEGYHQDRRCRLFCLNATTGEMIWEFKTKSHTESSPTVVNGKVYIGAGDDGLYCVDAKTGAKVWNYPNVHVDAAPVVIGNRVYCGSGVGDVHKETAIFCVDAETGKELWRMPTELPVWGSPVIEGDYAYFGVGNGNFIEDAEKPAGALWCVKTATGQRIWEYKTPNGVLARPALDSNTVYFTCRDGNCYAVDRAEGKLRWKRPLGSPVVAAPALAGGCPHCGQGQSLYAIATKGQVYCLDSTTGAVAWTFDVAADSKKKPALFSSPRVFVTQDKKGERRSIYFGTGLDNVAEWHASLYCLEDRLQNGGTVHAEGQRPKVEGFAGR